VEEKRRERAWGGIEGRYSQRTSPESKGFSKNATSTHNKIKPSTEQRTVKEKMQEDDSSAHKKITGRISKF
jgi:hypothetical protein